MASTFRKLSPAGRQAIDIAHNIVVAHLVVNHLDASELQCLRLRIEHIFSDSASALITETEAALRFDALGHSRQLLLLAAALASSNMNECRATGSPRIEWVHFDNPLALDVDHRDVLAARKLLFRWQSSLPLQGGAVSALNYFYRHWKVGGEQGQQYRQRDAVPRTGIALGL